MRTRHRPGQTRQGERQARDAGGLCLCAFPWNLGQGEGLSARDPSVLRLSTEERAATRGSSERLGLQL